MLVQCQHCHLYFQDNAQLVSHLTKQHPGINASNTVPSSSNTLASSSNTTCYVCSKVLLTEQELQFHREQAHANVKDLKCKELGCGYATSSVKNFELHQCSHLTNDFKYCKVPGCPFKTATVYQLNKHVKAKHAKEIYKCIVTVCDFQSRTRMQVNRHIREKHREKLLKCGEKGCDKVFIHLKSLKEHQRTHMMPGIRCFYPGCGQTSKTNAQAAAHAKTHTQRAVIPCGVCGLVLSTKSTLRAHMRTFHQDQRIKCLVEGCTFWAIDQKDLNDHDWKIHNTILSNPVVPIVSSIDSRVPQVTHQGPTTSAIQEPSSAIHTPPPPYPAQQNIMANQRDIAAPNQYPTASAGLSSSPKYKNG